MPATPARFQFEVVARRGRARAARLQTPHGEVKTPVFMPVGTRASVKSLDSEDLAALGAQIILANTYHLHLRPGAATIAQAGGLQTFTRWQRPMLTDSGGFQVFSLGAQRTQVGRANRVQLSEAGASFKSHLDGSEQFLSPESALEIQRQLGADIIMVFDECAPDDASPDYLAESVARTSRWALRSYQAWQEANYQSEAGFYQALFGIVQGGTHLELRQRSLRDLKEIGFDGYALGGETVGYNLPATQALMSELEAALPAEKPRYAMGMGREPVDVVEAILMGFDLFDCVGPTRLARNGALFYGQLDVKAGRPFFRSDLPRARLLIGQARYRTDERPIQLDCDCETCRQGYSRAYLHHLYHTTELAYYRLASRHNLRLMVRTAEEMRAWLLR